MRHDSRSCTRDTPAWRGADGAARNEGAASGGSKGTGGWLRVRMSQSSNLILRRQKSRLRSDDHLPGRDLLQTCRQRLTRARSASAGSRECVSSRRDAPTYLTSVSEGEQLRSGSEDPSPVYDSDIHTTLASSVEWNGPPATRATADERQPPITPPRLRQ